MSDQTISTKELREELPKIRAGLARGNHYTLIYRSKPIARLEPVPKETPQNLKIVGGGFRLQEKAGHPLTPEYLNKLAEGKFE
jgi:antitoxin (DNA-binding transcriptional repressor) of toxin-antitoxin stability system